MDKDLSKHTYPTKWRETMDPFSLKFNQFVLKEILGYPHAGNDVFYVSGIEKGGKKIRAFLKVCECQPEFEPGDILSLSHS